MCSRHDCGNCTNHFTDLDYHWIREGSQLKRLSLPRLKKRRATHKASSRGNTQRRDALMSPRGSREATFVSGAREPRRSRALSAGPTTSMGKENESWFGGDRCSSPPPVGPEPEVVSGCHILSQKCASTFAVVLYCILPGRPIDLLVQFLHNDHGE